MTNVESRQLAPAGLISRTALNSIAGGAIWAVGGIILDCNSHQVPASGSWLIGMPLILIAAFSAWGTFVSFLSASRHRIRLTILATIISLFLGCGGMFLFSFLIGNWPKLLATGIFPLFLGIGIYLGFLQFAIISGFNRPS